MNGLRAIATAADPINSCCWRIGLCAKCRILAYVGVPNAPSADHGDLGLPSSTNTGKIFLICYLLLLEEFHIVGYLGFRGERNHNKQQLHRFIEVENE